MIFSQKNSYDLVNLSIETYLKSKGELSKSEELYVYLMDNPIFFTEDDGLLNLKHNQINNTKIKYLSSDELKKYRKKGINILKIYPLRLNLEGELYILIEEMILEKKQQELIGKTSYFFEQDYKSNKYFITKTYQNLY